uniref:Splicing factor Cactin n=1 Tax=Piliocolobus tephrosceles TaxID=591936 RepID=A0A8C9LPP1_9PRIM
MKDHFNYTNECNPFGDNTLSTPFVWKLKNKYEKIKNNNKIIVTTDSLLENSFSKVNEIQQVKKRRAERDQERAMLEDYRLQLEKQKNQINVQEYIKNEQLFFINQLLQSSDSRINQNMPQFVDIFRLASQIVFEKKAQVTIHSYYYQAPFYVLLKDLNKEELENNTKQLKLLILHDQILNERKNEKYWNALLFFSEYYLNKLEDKKSNEHYMNDDTMNEKKETKSEAELKIEKKIESFFKNKTYEELITYEEQIKKNISMDNINQDDATYWNTVLLKLPYLKAKCVLDLFYKQFCVTKSIDTNICQHPHSIYKYSEKNELAKKGKEKEIEKLLTECKSPDLISNEQIEQNEEIIYDSEEEFKERTKISQNILNMLKQKLNIELENELKNKLGNEEWSHQKSSNNNYNLFEEKSKNVYLKQQNQQNSNNDEIILNRNFVKEKKIYYNFIQKEKRKKGMKDSGGGILLNDINYNTTTVTNILKNTLFVIRKPLYFNKVKTSFDWNKYNKTHYDYENTPPKYICGYKFNIFYTNLLNKSEKPTWKLCACEEENKVLIIFHGGLPYLDLTFKIVNAEWCYDKHRGFRNVFDKGILQLYFNFKKKDTCVEICIMCYPFVKKLFKKTDEIFIFIYIL